MPSPISPLSAMTGFWERRKEPFPTLGGWLCFYPAPGVSFPPWGWFWRQSFFTPPVLQ